MKQMVESKTVFLGEDHNRGARIEVNTSQPHPVTLAFIGSFPHQGGFPVFSKEAWEDFVRMVNAVKL
jgi:hypothetical protein